MAFGGVIITSEIIRQIASKQFDKIQAIESRSEKKSFLGTPVVSNLEIQPFNYQSLDGTTVEIDSPIRIDSVLMNITQTKNIVSTTVQGRNGAVKEYISDGDYNISIMGVLTSKTGEFPREDLNTLIEICKAPTTIKVESEFLGFFGATEIVIESYNFPQMAGHENEQSFSINALSDRPIELTNIEF